MRILVVEDEKSLNRVITKRLESEGYSVDSCFDGEEALHFASVGEFDAVVMDIMMPKINGIEVVKRLRDRNDKTPVIFLTAKDSVSDRVTGLDAGAEDYLVKPFAFEELLARIRVMTRKAAGSATNVFTISDLTLDTVSKTVVRGDKNTNLSAKEYEILEYMILNQGIVLSREKIENHVWNFDYSGGTNVVDVYIRYLRKKIDDEYEEKLIHTVRGMGYVLRIE
ncbi:MAG: response regulator transcription factor [Clostridia bacterium]|nr:response regulator transcription factor [Clostridia bacterium]MCI9085895.1 response regulator transcription factor [Clostridia bacterium]